MPKQNALTAGTPRWVKVSAVVVLVLVALAVVLIVSGHEVGRHAGAGSVFALTS